MVGATCSDGAWGGEVMFGEGVHLMFGFSSPLSVGFNGTKDSNVVLVDESASVNPFAPVLVGIDSACILESNTECGWLEGVGNRCHGVAPGLCGEGWCGCCCGGMGVGWGKVSVIEL